MMRFSDTGDVQFICLERQQQTAAQTSPRRRSSDATTPISHRSSSSASSHSLFPSHTTARKRVIYAHSDILTRRSEYFATMLASAFSENNPGLVQGDRKLYSIVVEEAEFETIYWLLKWCYANWLLFKELDDPRAAVDGVGAGWSARWLNARGGDWDWKTFRKISASEETSNLGNRDDARSATSVESLRSNAAGSTTSSKGKTLQATTTAAATTKQPSGAKGALSSSKISTSSPNPSRSSNSTGHRQSLPGSSTTNHSSMTMAIGHPSTSSASRTKSIPIPLSVPTANYSSSHYPLSPRSQRPHSHPSMSTPDPHPHPTPAPPPASALSMYQVAHRYAMPGLATLALEHMMSTITPQSSFALLLATSVWDELRSLIEVC